VSAASPPRASTRPPPHKRQSSTAYPVRPACTPPLLTSARARAADVSVPSPARTPTPRHKVCPRGLPHHHHHHPHLHRQPRRRRAQRPHPFPHLARSLARPLFFLPHPLPHCACALTSPPPLRHSAAHFSFLAAVALSISAFGRRIVRAVLLPTFVPLSPHRRCLEAP